MATIRLKPALTPTPASALDTAVQIGLQDRAQRGNLQRQLTTQRQAQQFQAGQQTERLQAQQGLQQQRASKSVFDLLIRSFQGLETAEEMQLFKQKASDTPELKAIFTANGIDPLMLPVTALDSAARKQQASQQTSADVARQVALQGAQFQIATDPRTGQPASFLKSVVREQRLAPVTGGKASGRRRLSTASGQRNRRGIGQPTTAQPTQATGGLGAQADQAAAAAALRQQQIAALNALQAGAAPATTPAPTPTPAAAPAPVLAEGVTEKTVGNQRLIQGVDLVVYDVSQLSPEQLANVRAGRPING